ncbi:MAG: hypothetical protein Q4P72_04890 [Eubacteriales bacterium]|nr:hypothetical protein [Eubacteriales bacterium]
MKQRLRQVMAVSMATAMSLGMLSFAPKLMAEESESAASDAETKVSYVEYDAAHYESMERLDPGREAAVRESLKNNGKQNMKGDISLDVQLDMVGLEATISAALSGKFSQSETGDAGVNLDVELVVPMILEGTSKLNLEIYKVASATDAEKIDLFFRVKGKLGDEDIEELQKTAVDKSELEEAFGKESPFEADFLKFYVKPEAGDDIVTMLVPVDELVKVLQAQDSSGESYEKSVKELEENLEKICSIGNISSLVLPIDLHVDAEGQVVGAEADWTNFFSLVLEAMKDQPDLAEMVSYVAFKKFSFSSHNEPADQVSIEVPEDLVAATSE